MVISLALRGSNIKIVENLRGQGRQQVIQELMRANDITISQASELRQHIEVRMMLVVSR